MKDLGKYYEWADGRIIGLLDKMDEGHFSEKVRGADRSVRELAEHLIVYYDYFLTKEKERFLEIQESLKKMDKNELLDFWKKAVGKFAEAVDGFTEDPVEIQDANKGSIKVPRNKYLLLYTDHATYHRGQLITLFKTVTGEEAVNTDYYEFLISRSN